MHPSMDENIPNDESEKERKVTQDELEDDCYISFDADDEFAEGIQAESLGIHRWADHARLLGGPYDGFYVKLPKGEVSFISVVVIKDFFKLKLDSLKLPESVPSWCEGEGVDVSKVEEYNLANVRLRKAVYKINNNFQTERDAESEVDDYIYTGSVPERVM